MCLLLNYLLTTTITLLRISRLYSHTCYTLPLLAQIYVHSYFSKLYFLTTFTLYLYYMSPQFLNSWFIWQNFTISCTAKQIVHISIKVQMWLKSRKIFYSAFCHADLMYFYTFEWISTIFWLKISLQGILLLFYR